jgi:hypothetical protein
MDSEFSAAQNFDFMTSQGKYFVAALKENRLVALNEKEDEALRVSR